MEKSMAEFYKYSVEDLGITSRVQLCYDLFNFVVGKYPSMTLDTFYELEKGLYCEFVGGNLDDCQQEI